MPEIREHIASFFYLKIFILVVVLVIIVSIGIRFGIEVTQSSFTNNSFSLLYLAKDSKIISVDNAEKMASFIALGDVRAITRGKSPLEISLILGLPISCVIVDENAPFSNTHELTSIGTELDLIVGNRRFKNCNRYDIFKLVQAVRSVPEDNRTEKRVNLKRLEKGIFDETFKDSVVNNTELTVEIDNGTSINGLGSELAQILSRVGFNVIAVRTVTNDKESYIAYPGEPNLYLNTLVGLTHFPVKREKVSKSADITVHLGDDLDILLDQ